MQQKGVGFVALFGWSHPLRFGFVSARSDFELIHSYVVVRGGSSSMKSHQTIRAHKEVFWGCDLRTVDDRSGSDTVAGWKIAAKLVRPSEAGVAFFSGKRRLTEASRTRAPFRRHGPVYANAAV